MVCSILAYYISESIVKVLNWACFFHQEPWESAHVTAQTRCSRSAIHDCFSSLLLCQILKSMLLLKIARVESGRDSLFTPPWIVITQIKAEGFCNLLWSDKKGGTLPVILLFCCCFPCFWLLLLLICTWDKNSVPDRNEYSRDRETGSIPHNICHWSHICLTRPTRNKRPNTLETKIHCLRTAWNI